MQKIKISKEKYAIIDDKDLNKVSKYGWFISAKNSHVFGRVNGKIVYLHHFLFGKPEKGLVLDHINRNAFDNRKENLRICSQSQNRQNSNIQKNNTSGFKGVSPRKGKWKVEIKVDKKRLYLGDFKDKIEAAKIYNTAAIKYFGEFARINEI